MSPRSIAKAVALIARWRRDTVDGIVQEPPGPEAMFGNERSEEQSGSLVRGFPSSVKRDFQQRVHSIGGHCEVILIHWMVSFFGI